MRISLSEPDPAWPAHFAALAKRITAEFDAATVEVHHVGSTCVPGLAAKPTIDVLVLVPDAADEAGYVPALVRAGLTLWIREPTWHEHRLLKATLPAANVHVFSRGCTEAARMVAFRDALRAAPCALRRYERLKRRLAERDWPSVQAYADAKSAFIEALLSGMGYEPA